MLPLKDGYTTHYCTHCRKRLHRDDGIAWRGDLPYCKAHAKHHKPEDVRVSRDTAIAMMPIQPRPLIVRKHLQEEN